MSDQFPICEVALPAAGRAADGSLLRAILKRQPPGKPALNRVDRWPAQVASDLEPQHWDTLLSRNEEPRPGAHLISPRRRYVHHGIYVGDGKVVHYSGLARGQLRGRIEEASLAEFAYGRSVWTRSSDLTEFPPQEVIARARSRVGENRYRILRNNCEHFCEWCLHGESRSYQVERFLCSRPALGMILGVI